MAKNVIFKYGTLEQYNALAVKDANTLYWLTDVMKLRKGETLYGKGTEATTLASGLMSAADKAKLDALSSSSAVGLTPVDATVVIADSEDGTGKTIGVQVSAEEGNTLSVKEDGLFVPTPAATAVPEYAIEKMETATEGFSATYKLKRTEGDTVTYAGDVINIPKDLVLQSGDTKVVEEADKPYAGAVVGESYMDLVLNDPDSSHIYIPIRVAFGDNAPVVWEEM